MGRWKTFNLLVQLASFRTPGLPIWNPFPRRNPWTSGQPVCTPPKIQLCFRAVCSFAASSASYAHEFDNESIEFGRNYDLECHDEEEEHGTIPIKSFFISTSINLKSMQAENVRNVLPPSSRTSNYIALRFRDEPSYLSGFTLDDKSCYRYMLVFQYGSTVLFNIDDDEVESYLDLVRRHATGLLPEVTKDDYAMKENPRLPEVMLGGPDYVTLRRLDTDSIRIIGSVLSQSIALDYFVSQVDAMVGEFTEINRDMEKSGTFKMERKKLFQLVGKANSNLGDIILKVGLFDRSEIAWRDAACAQIHEYLREEFEVTQRFGNLDYKLKFVEHNIHFLQEVLQNRKSDFLEWCIILLLVIENVIGIYEIVKESAVGSL